MNYQIRKCTLNYSCNKHTECRHHAPHPFHIYKSKHHLCYHHNKPTHWKKHKPQTINHKDPPRKHRKYIFIANKGFHFPPNDKHKHRTSTITHKTPSIESPLNQHSANKQIKQKPNPKNRKCNLKTNNKNPKSAKKKGFVIFPEPSVSEKEKKRGDLKKRSGIGDVVANSALRRDSDQCIYLLVACYCKWSESSTCICWEGD